MVLREPHTIIANFLGVDDLVQGLPDAPGFAFLIPGFRDLYLIEKTELHNIPPSFVSVIIWLAQAPSTPRLGVIKED
jgi:hypothetical protein